MGAASYFYSETINNTFWSSSPTGTAARILNFNAGAESTGHSYNSYRAICFRGNRAPASKLAINPNSKTLVGENVTSQVYVQTQAADGNNVYASGKVITLSATNLGNLGGTLNATTDIDPTSSVSIADQSLVDYCRDLEEGGFTDWRAVKLQEVIDAAA